MESSQGIPSDGPQPSRLKFYGMNDYGTFWQAERVSSVASNVIDNESSINDVLEAHNASLFLAQDVFPRDMTDEDRRAVRNQVPKLRELIARHFQGLDTENIQSSIINVDWQYRDDLLELLVRHEVTERIAGEMMISVLERNHISIGHMLANRRFVRAYDGSIRNLLTGDARNAEFVFRKYLQKADRKPVYLPKSFSQVDAADLVKRYIESNDANPNYLQLIANSKPSAEAGVTDKVRLAAKRAHEAWTTKFFSSNETSGFRTGVQISMVEDLEEVVSVELNDGIAEYTYSTKWLRDNLDFATILNNFIYVFEFANSHMQLLSPASQSQLSLVERIAGVAGRQYYPVGVAFQHKDLASFYQLMVYEQFLAQHEVDLEAVVAWFFNEYLAEEFGAENFRFQSSSANSTYLERCRHLFPEMDSVIRQFALYVENGELDVDLLTMSSTPISFKDIPSQEHLKYVYVSADRTIQSIQYLLFSDQSMLNFINEELQADSTFELLRENSLSRRDFAEHQEPNIDLLIAADILYEDNGKLLFVNDAQISVLVALWKMESASYLHFSNAGRSAIDNMLAKGWLETRSGLLSTPEAQYYNYMLNASEFSNGPDLRNGYAHGSQKRSDSNDVHHKTYLTVMKLLIGLVIKMNDDFELHAQPETRRTSDG